jgi:hypothetical protein
MKKIIPILETNMIAVDKAVLVLASGGMSSGGYKPFTVTSGTSSSRQAGGAHREVADHNRGEFTYSTRAPGATGGGGRGSEGNINMGASDRPGGQSNYQQQQVTGQVVTSPNTSAQGGGTRDWNVGW